MDKYNKIKELAENIEVRPPIASWSKIERKLDADVTKSPKSTKVFRSMFVAATILLFMGCFYFVYTESTKSLLMDKGHIVQWEDLGPDNESYYDVWSVRHLQAAYLK